MKYTRKKTKNKFEKFIFIYLFFIYLFLFIYFYENKFDKQVVCRNLGIY